MINTRERVPKRINIITITITLILDLTQPLPWPPPPTNYFGYDWRQNNNFVIYNPPRASHCERLVIYASTHPPHSHVIVANPCHCVGIHNQTHTRKWNERSTLDAWVILDTTRAWRKQADSCVYHSTSGLTLSLSSISGGSNRLG